MPDDGGQSFVQPPASQPTLGDSPTPLTSRPKKPKKLLIIAASVIVVLLIAAGMLAYLLLVVQPKEDSGSTKPTDLTSLGNGLKGSLDKPTDASALVYKTTNPASVVYRYDETNWVTSDSGVNILTVSSQRAKTADNKSDYTAVINYLNANEFTQIKLAGQPTAGYSSSQSIAQYFASPQFSCNLHNTLEPALTTGAVSQPALYRLQLDCAKVSDFKTNIDAIKPLAQAYAQAKVTGAIKDPLFSTPVILNSVTKDYKNGSVTIASVTSPTGSSSGEFYQTPDKAWHFFATTKDRDKISCGQYLGAGSDIQKAFIGFTCFDDASNKSSFVAEPNPTFEVVPGAISSDK